MESIEDESRMIKRRRICETDDDGQRHLSYLPHDLIVGNILTRLGVESLIRFSTVCKPWYNLIHNDPHFASSHTLMQSQSCPRLIFNFLNVECPDKHTSHFFYLTDKEYDDDDDDDGVDNLCFTEFTTLEGNFEKKLVGYCNGLICLLGDGMIDIFNPSRVTLFSIFPPSKDGEIICYGFGFDSLTKAYKTVLIFSTEEDEYECLVFTLGTNSWRKTTISPPSPHQIFSTQPHVRSAVFCGGALFWRTCSDELANEKMLLLSFDLHDETFQVIHVPDECVSKTTMKQQQELVHLLEFKGYVCVARLEKLTCESSNTEHDDGNIGSSSTSKSSCSKVHLHLLKIDKLKQVWNKVTFDLLPSLSLPCFDDTPTSNFTFTTAPRVQVVSFCGRLLLYWFDGKVCGLQLYDLQSKHLKVVWPCQDNLQHNGYVDYQLNSHIENLLPLETFVPMELANRH